MATLTVNESSEAGNVDVNKSPAAATIAEKKLPATVTAPVNESPEAQVDQYMEEGKPVFVFFHSTNCQSCIVMMGIVDQVYPEFKEHVALVDVDVYDSQNNNLLKRARVQAIPTLYFIDKKGQGKYAVGVMEADQFREQLQLLKENQ